MTVVVQTPYNAHIANGVTTLFGFDFQLLDAADLQVSLDGAVQSTGFSIAGIGVQSGGSITFAVAPASNVLVEIQRLIPLARSIDYQLNGDLPSDQVDRDFDRLWQALQDAAYFAGLTVGLPAGDTAAPVILPSVANRANTFFAFDSLGQAIAALGVPSVPVTAFAATLLDDMNAAGARATLGLGSAATESVVPVNKGGTGQTTALGIESILPINQARVDVASAATVNLTTGAASTDHINITGTTTITAFTVAAGRTIFVRFAGALTLTNNANIVTQSGANIVTAAGDTCILRATAANVVEVLAYTRGIPQALGDGQAWQSITGSRALNTTYTNSTGRTIFVAVAVTGSTVNTANIQVLVNSVIVIDSNIGVNSTADVGDYFFPVPAGHTYRVDLLAGSGALRTWGELR